MFPQTGKAIVVLTSKRPNWVCLKRTRIMLESAQSYRALNRYISLCGLCFFIK